MPPWSRFVPQLGGEILGRWQSCLIGIGLMLLRAPSLVRASSFADAGMGVQIVIALSGVQCMRAARVSFRSLCSPLANFG